MHWRKKFRFSGFEHINVGKLIREYELYDEYDEEMDCHVLNEDKLLDHIEVFKF